MTHNPDVSTTPVDLTARIDQLQRQLDQVTAERDRAFDAARGAAKRLHDHRSQLMVALGISDLVEDLVDEAVDRVAQSIRRDVDELSDTSSALARRVEELEDQPIADDVRASLRDMIEHGDLTLSIDLM